MSGGIDAQDDFEVPEIIKGQWRKRYGNSIPWTKYQKSARNLQQDADAVKLAYAFAVSVENYLTGCRKNYVISSEEICTLWDNCLSQDTSLYSFDLAIKLLKQFWKRYQRFAKRLSF